MKTERVNIWQKQGEAVYVHPDARRLVSLPCYIKTFLLRGDDGRQCEVAMALHVRPPLCLIPPDAPAWAEKAVSELIDEEGNTR